MQIPKKIKIGGFIIEVIYENNLMTDRQHTGEYHPRIQTIKIDKDCSEQEKEEVFVHELLEAIKAIYNIELYHRELTLLATVLHQVIKDSRTPRGVCGLKRITSILVHTPAAVAPIPGTRTEILVL